MVATLVHRREALEAKILEKTQELKKLCLQEADLTGVLPPETPLDPGEPPPAIRRRVGTSFSFPQSLINNLSATDDVALNDLELECKVQTNIAEAALNIANDTSANKAVRRKHRNMYRQSQIRLLELETRLALLKQGKPQPLKANHIKKKPRPNTTTVDPNQLMRAMNVQNHHYASSRLGSWPVRAETGYCYEDDPRHFSSLHRPPRSNGTSHSSGSPMLSVGDLSAFNHSGLPDQISLTSSLSQPNIQDFKMPSIDVNDGKRPERSSGRRRQWDTISAGGTLLPNQTYPETHQLNLNRTQSLGSVDGQRQSKEKEWYETSLDSAPSPPLRSSSRLPSSARLMYHMQEQQIRDAVTRSLTPQMKPHVSLTRSNAHAPQTVRATPIDDITNTLHNMRVSAPLPSRAEKPPTIDPRPSDAVYIDIPEDIVDAGISWGPLAAEGSKTPTQAFYHSHPDWTPPVPGMHPPHAVTQGEIIFDTVVPFESPQNHTVVQAGVWQPYREVTKPFEMSDFYKYSTKFRQARQSPGATTTSNGRQGDHSASPGSCPTPAPRQSPNTMVGVYKPLRPMTCQPIESRTSNYFDSPEPPSVSTPKIV